EQEQLVLITQTMADGLYVLDQNGQTSFINGPGAETLGFDAEELLGKPIHDLVHAHAKNDNIPLEKCPIFAAALTGVEYEGEEIFLNKQGQDFQVEVAARPLKLHNQLVGVVTLFRDITQRKAREQEREALIAALRRSNAEIARLAEITAHHLQEPVRRLATYSQMVRRRLQSEPGSAGRLSGDGVGLADIEAEALRTRDLLHDIQTYIEAGEAPKAAPMIDLNAAVRMVLDSRSAVMKDIDVETVVQDLPSIPFDPARLRRVFSILIDNALQHRDPDRPLRIGVSAQETGDRVTVVVDDTGPGIPEAYRERVFRLFERLYPESRPAGTGTGLSIVRRLMECAGGSVRIAESPSGGTRVFLDFPAKAPLRLEGLPIASGEMADPKAPSEPAMPREMPELTTLQKRDAA
ncbi:MAG: sensor histidine kinase, partial [Rhodospirillaceae bacterium]